MSDYISRDALMQHIKCRNHRDCANCDFYKDGDSWCDGEIHGTTIMQAPTVDAVPVVRCKDCEHSKELLDYDGCNLYCLIWGREFPKVLPDDFCSRGERRTKWT